MNKIKTNLLIIFTIVIGFAAISSFYFFYNEQKRFSKEQKEFLLALNRIEINEATLVLSLLQNYIYAYNNNDDIERPLLALERSFDTLSKTQILQKEKYKTLQADIQKLSKAIDELFNNTQKYIMLNASIKNSLIFLAGYDNRFLHRSKNKHIFEKASGIIESLLYTKRMNDIGFLNKDLYLPLNSSLTKEEEEFIKTFNMHIAFLEKTFPLFFQIDKKIKTSPIPTLVQKIKKDFSSIAINDTKLLDQFSIGLFVIFLVTYIYLLILLTQYKKEHNKLEKLTKQQHELLIYDHLTKVKNRFAFVREHQQLSHPIVLLVSIDRFKDINDVYGTTIGDDVLIVLARYLEQEAKEKEKSFFELYRIGGDEFCLLFDHTSLTLVKDFAYRLYRDLANKEFVIGGIEINITVSLAISEQKPLLENADLALKHIKKDKNQKIVVFNENLNLHQASYENVKMLNIIKRAIRNDNIVIYYQPIVNLKHKIVEKYEVLVRIIDNDEVILPYKFLDISKKTHLYQDITRIVIEKTIQTAKLYPKFRFSINLAMSDIQNQALIEELFFLFEANPAIASRIDVELLETEGLDDISKVKTFIDRLHSFGSKVLIDDFGSGYSNFAYFSELDIDIVKIDGSIINEIATNERKLHMLESITKFCKGMELKMVGEFVDSKEIVVILERLGIEYAQGFYFSKPLPQPKIEEITWS